MANLSKNQRKELLRSREHEALVTAELQRERRVGEDVFWRGVGERVLQICEISSFSGGSVWDVRRVDDRLFLYVSEINSEKPGYLHPGYTCLEAEPHRLTNLLEDLATAKVASWSPVKSNIGLDGTTTSVEFRSGFATAAFSWWEEGPVEWRELAVVVQQALCEFKMLSNPSFKRTPDGAA